MKSFFYRLKAFVGILFLCIVFLVGFAHIYYTQHVLQRAYFEKFRWAPIVMKYYTLKLYVLAHYWRSDISIVGGIACRLLWNNFRSFASARKRLMEYIKARLSCWSRASLKMCIQLVIQRARLTSQGLHYLRVVGGRSQYRFFLFNILHNKFFFITVHRAW